MRLKILATSKCDNYPVLTNDAMSRLLWNVMSRKDGLLYNEPQEWFDDDGRRHTSTNDPSLEEIAATLSKEYSLDVPYEVFLRALHDGYLRTAQLHNILA
jgi:hypothetical protein